MYENNHSEQYFYNRETIQFLCDELTGFNNICCLCTPTIGMELLKRGKTVRILDVDRRFECFEGFMYFNISRPQWLGEKYDVIVCDPPFFTTSLSQLFLTLRTLSLNDFNQPILITCLQRRAAKFISTFTPFSLVPTGYFPGYQTVEECDRNTIQVFSNCGVPKKSG